MSFNEESIRNSLVQILSHKRIVDTFHNEDRVFEPYSKFKEDYILEK